MRNLKKVLALVLSLVMALSMVTIASAYEATPGTLYPDDADITEFDEAIQVLNQLEILQGRDTGDLDPNTAINRAEAATMIYRAVTGDVDGSDLPMYADDALTDVKVTDWFSGAVNYCVNHGIVRGRDDGSFDPYEKVTGYEAMAMMLRAIGYDNGNGFSGATWQTQTAQFATTSGIHTGFNGAALRLPASRAVVSEIIFRSIAKTSKVTNNGLGANQPLNYTVAYDVFGLYGDPTIRAMDQGDGTTAIGSIAANTKNPLTGAARYEEDDLALMVNRLPADVDLVLEGYGAPVAKWYLEGRDQFDAIIRDGSLDISGANDDSGAIGAGTDGELGADVRVSNKVITDDLVDDEIVVLFNPAKAWTTVVTVQDLYNAVRDAGALAANGNTTKNLPGSAALHAAHAGDETDVALRYHVDGMPALNLVQSLASDETADRRIENTYTRTTAGQNAAMMLKDTGKGVHTDLYYEDGNLFMTVKNVFVAKVSNRTATGFVTLYDGSADNETNLIAATATGYSDAGTALTEAIATGEYDGWISTATYEGLSRGDVVTFAVMNDLCETNANTGETYGRIIDFESVNKANVTSAEVTNSYINANANAAFSHEDTVEGNRDTQVSWFLAGGKTWEYNRQYGATLVDDAAEDIEAKFPDNAKPDSANFPGEDTGNNTDGEPVLSATKSDLADLLVDREELLAVNQTRQAIYTDECGYVVWTEEDTDPVQKGYIALQYGAYANRGYDNLYYVTYNGINHEGQQISITGGYKQSYFLTQKEATDAAAAEIGLYWYEQDLTGNYILETVSAPLNDTTPGAGVLADGTIAMGGTEGAGGASVAHLSTGIVVHHEDTDGGLTTIMAGDADAIDNTTSPADDTTEVLDDNTLFVIAQYDRMGRLTGYRTEVGYKNIPDMVDGQITPAYIIDAAARETIPFEVYYTTLAGDLDATTAAGDQIIDMVLVLGAKCTDDPTGAATGDDMFYLLDITPDELFDEYDTHKVLMKGVPTDLRTIKGLVHMDPDVEGADNEAGMYKIVRRSNGLVAGVEPLNGLHRITWVSDGVLSTTEAGIGDTNTYDWNARGTEVDYETGVAGGYVPYADGCKFYIIAGATANEFELTTANIGLYLDGDFMGYVAATNEYGMATVVYVVAPATAYT